MRITQAQRLAIIERRQRVADLYLQGWTQLAIAREVGVSQGMICVDLKQIRKDWRESAIRDFDAMRDEELRRLERIEREAWDAWERSQKPVQSAKIHDQQANGKGHKTVKSQVGNPRFLELVVKCVESRRTMLGLDAPKLIAPTTPSGAPLSMEERHGVINAILVEKFGMAGLAEEVIDDSGTSAAALTLAVGRGIAEAEPAQLCLEADRGAQETPSAPGGVPEADV